MNTCPTPCSDNSFISLPQRLVEALGRLETQQSNTIVGSVYIYDLVQQRTLCASCSVAAMLGYSADAIHAMDGVGLASLIHPDDLDLVSEHYQHFTTLQLGQAIASNYRMRRADGTWCWLRSQETPLVTASDGFPLQILGIVQVMTQPSITKLEDLLNLAYFSDNLN
jgi:PAS domain S-box-containing protein